MSKTVINFSLEKETKNSARYKELPEAGKEPVVGSLYVKNVVCR